MKPRLAVYAGSFDPPTTGHLWMIKQGAMMFDNLIVAIGVNPNKKYLFSLDDRMEMLEKITSFDRGIKIDNYPHKFLIAYAKEMKAQFILRGIRSIADYEFETTMRNLNGDFEPNITTVFLMPPREIRDISSSVIKGLIGPNGWEEIVKSYIPPEVMNYLKKAAQ